MEELSPPISVALNLVNPICENPSISSHSEITRLKLDTESASLVSIPALVLDNSASTSHDTFNNDHVNPSITEVATSLMLEGNESANPGSSKPDEVIESSRLFDQSEEDEVLSVSEDACLLSGVELLPLDSAPDLLRVPLDATPETSLPIAVEIEGTENGEIVAKVISLEERSIKMKSSGDAKTLSSEPNEESSSEPRIKASVVSVQLPTEKNDSGGTKGSVKSVFELDCLPLWGLVSVIGQRPEMEDAVMVAPHFAKIPIKMFIGDHGTAGISQTLTHLTSHFFGVYDGHGGSQVANYCRDRIHLALLEELKNVKDTTPLNGITIDTRQAQWERVFHSCFLQVDNEVSGKASRSLDEQICTVEPVAPETVGSTAVVAVVCSSHIIVANCGDSRAVLYRGKEAMPLSVDHKPDREDEYARIEASDGKVIQWNGHRVFGVLAMSRAIGDRYLKPWIIPEPEVTFVPRAREDECLILATDGLWDVMTNEEVCEIAKKRILIWHKKNGTNPLIDRGQGIDMAAQSAADYLSNIAVQRGSKDNISIVVVDLKAQRKFKTKS